MEYQTVIPIKGLKYELESLIECLKDDFYRPDKRFRIKLAATTRVRKQS